MFEKGEPRFLNFPKNNIKNRPQVLYISKI